MSAQSDKEIVVIATGHLEAHIHRYGLTVHRLIVKTSTGTQDILIGPESASAVISDGRQFRNTIIGRYANRLPVDAANAAVGLTLNGENGVLLHSGPEGFDQRTWDVLEQSPDGQSAVFGLESLDGDQARR